MLVGSTRLYNHKDQSSLELATQDRDEILSILSKAGLKGFSVCLLDDGSFTSEPEYYYVLVEYCNTKYE